MAACLVIGLLSATPASGAGRSNADATAKSHVLVGTPGAAPVHCSARKAVKFYAGRIAYWRSKMGASDSRLEHRTVRPHACPSYLAHVLQRKAYAAHKAFTRWHEHHYHWEAWLPAKWQRIGACETGYGRRPGSWTWDSGTYVSAFGIYRAGYSQFAHEIGQLSWDETRSRLGRYPTPREQFNVALRIYYHYGFSGWGCRNA